MTIYTNAENATAAEIRECNGSWLLTTAESDGTSWTGHFPTELEACEFLLLLATGWDRAPSPKAAERSEKPSRALVIAAASRFLERHGCSILDTEWKCSAGKADIVFLDRDGTLVFANVKVRNGIDKGYPSDRSAKKMREKMEAVSLCYVQDNFLGEAVMRFDQLSVVTMRGGRCCMRHHIGAYSAGA